MEFTLSTAPVTASGEDRQFVLALIQNLKYLHRVAETLELATCDIEDVLSQIKNQILSVVVVGEFKRGKSTFINALLGESILPSDILPTTATINRIVFGSIPSAVVRFKDGQERTIAINQLKDYVTKLTLDAEATSSAVQEAVIHYPLHYCRNGLEIIDTPGLSDDDIMTEVTLSVLRRSKVVVMVISATSPFAESEGKFLTETLLKQGISHILFVVNGIDRFKSSEDIERVLENIRKRVEKYINEWADCEFGRGTQAYYDYLKRVGNPCVYGLSSQQALQAKCTKDEFLLERSRFQAFEVVLSRLLIEERQRIVLQISLETTIAVAGQILEVLKTRCRLLQTQRQFFAKNSLSIVENLSMLRDQSREDLAHINRSIIHLEIEVTTILKSLSNRLEQVAEQTIDNTIIDTSNSFNTINNYFAKRVADALQQVVLETESNITTIVQQKITEQLQALQSVVSAFEQKMCQIQDKWTQIENNSTLAGTINQLHDLNYQSRIQHLSGLLPISANLLTISEEATGGYTAAGAVIGSLFSLGIGTGIGAAIGASLGEQRRKQTFKQSYKPQILLVIKARLESEEMRQKANEYLTQQTERLKVLSSQIGQQIETAIDEAEKKLSVLQGRQDAKASTEQHRMEESETEVQQIFSHAYQLRERLT